MPQKDDPKRKARDKAYREKHKEARVAYNRQWRAKARAKSGRPTFAPMDPADALERRKYRESLWRKANPDKVLLKDAKASVARFLGVSRSDVPLALAEAKASQLAVKRAIASTRRRTSEQSAS